MPCLPFCLAALLLCLSGAADATDVAGVRLADRVHVGAAATPLTLNGAGVRKKFFLSIYVGALYLPFTTTSAAEALAQAGPKAVHMHFLYSKVSAEKLVQGWNEGFERNQDEVARQALHSRIEAFNALFPDLHAGDSVWLHYLPTQGTEVWINEQRRGVIAGADFFTALLAIWLGKEPVTKDLKAALLGDG